METCWGFGKQDWVRTVNEIIFFCLSAGVSGWFNRFINHWKKVTGERDAFLVIFMVTNVVMMVTMKLK